MAVREDELGERADQVIESGWPRKRNAELVARLAILLRA